MPRRKRVDIPKAVEGGVALLSEHLDRLRTKARAKGLNPSEFYMLDRATERLHQLQQEIDGAVPKRILERMSPEDLDTVTSIFARYGI